MNKYPNHSIVRVHTDTLDKIKWLSADMKLKPPKVLDILVDYFIEREKNYPNKTEGRDE